MNGFRVQSPLRPSRCHEALLLAEEDQADSGFELTVETKSRFSLRHAGPYQGNIFKSGLYLNGSLQEEGRGTVIKGWFSSSITIQQVIWALRVIAVVVFLVIAYRIAVPVNEERVVHFLHLLWPVLLLAATVPAQKRLQKIEKRWKRQLVEQVREMCYAKKREAVVSRRIRPEAEGQPKKKE